MSGYPTYPANLCLLLFGGELAKYSSDFGEAIDQPVESAHGAIDFGKRAPEHFEDMLSGLDSVEGTGQISLDRGGHRGFGQRQEGEGLPATGAATATNANPVAMRIVCLLAAASVTDDRIAFTNGASPQNGLGAACGPIGFDLARRDGKWDKENRSSLELCPGVDVPRSEPEAKLLPLIRKSQLEKNNAPRLQLS